MNKRYAFILLLFFLFLPCIHAQKKAVKRAINAAEVTIKSRKNLDKAEQSMRKLLQDSVNRDEIKVWVTLTDAVRAQYLVGNENLYLHLKQDTAALFKLAQKMFIDYQGLDSVDAMPDKKGRVKLRYRKSNATFLNTYRPNLYNGGIYFIRKNNLKEAYSMLESYLNCLRQPLFSDMHYEKDTLNRTAAFWTVFCGYQLNDHDLTLRYKDLALQDTSMLENCLQYLAETYKVMKDTTNFEKSLRMGFERYPQSSYFFPRIVDFYNNTNRADSALIIVNNALAVDDTLEIFRYAKSNLLLNSGDYDGCIAICDSLIANNDSLAEAYYNVGVAYVNKAFLIEKGRVGAKQRKQIRELYRKALPYMERYRKLAPKEKDKWAAALYNIYLRLNMGKEFEEIDRMLR